MPSRSALPISCAPLPRADRCLSRVPPRNASLHLLGLSGRTVAPRRGAAHRSFAVVAARGGPCSSLRDRQEAARQRPRLGPHADLVRAGAITASWFRHTTAGVLRFCYYSVDFCNVYRYNSRVVRWFGWVELIITPILTTLLKSSAKLAAAVPLPPSGLRSREAIPPVDSLQITGRTG